MKLLKSWAKGILSTARRQQLRRMARRWKHFGFKRYCPCCRARVRSFIACCLDPDPEAGCPVCGSLQRHRLIWLYLLAKTDLFDGRPKNVLHVAPEPQLSRLLQKTNGLNYFSADLSAPEAMVKMDITDIPYADHAFDVIYCTHVLEHVVDDRKAMRELFRVLKPGGWSILQVPVTAQVTLEDATVVSPDGRERVFGQYDHVRQYGPDYANRLADAGFSVTVDGFVRELGRRRVERFGLAWDEDVHFCRKR